MNYWDGFSHGILFGWLSSVASLGIVYRFREQIGNVLARIFTDCAGCQFGTVYYDHVCGKENPNRTYENLRRLATKRRRKVLNFDKSQTMANARR